VRLDEKKTSFPPSSDGPPAAGVNQTEAAFDSPTPTTVELACSANFGDPLDTRVGRMRVIVLQVQDTIP
jgi:hypothetical protein